MKLKADQVKQQITGLLLRFPALAEDDILRADMIEAETEAVEFLSEIECKRQDVDDIINGLLLRIERLKIRLERIRHQESGLRELEFQIMEIAGDKTRVLPEATLTMKKGSPKTIIIEEGLIPRPYWRVKYEPDKKKILADLKKGTAVPGATLSNAETILSISIAGDKKKTNGKQEATDDGGQDEGAS